MALPQANQFQTASAHKVTPSNLIVLITLLVIATVVRFPFLFPDVINWDESTYILMGQSILEGNLPYVELWEIKPPLAFLPYALISGLFDRSIMAMRIGALLLVAGTAYLTYIVGYSIWNRRTGLCAALICIIFSSVNGQSLMTETIAVVPLMGALTLLVVKKHSSRVLYLTGLLLATATLVRLNLAYVALFVGIYLCVKQYQSPGPNFKSELLAYIMGGLSLLFLTALPYLVSDNGGLWFSSVFVAPLNYSIGGISVFEAFTKYIQKGFPKFWLLWSVFLVGTIWLATNWNQQTKREKEGIVLVFIFFLSVLWSILATGRVHFHYLIQIAPLLSLVAGVLISHMLTKQWRYIVLALMVSGLIFPLKPVFTEYTAVADRMSAGIPLKQGTAYQIARFLEKENPNRAPVYLLDDHIVYWLTHTKPLTKSTTHPSNISKEYLLEIISGPGATALSEMAKVLGQKPLFIVKSKTNTWYLEYIPQARNLLVSELAENYLEVASFSDRVIYRRRDSN